MSARENESRDGVAIALAIVCWILPLAGLVYGPGEWWEYLLWLAIGSVVVAGYASTLDDDDESES